MSIDIRIATLESQVRTLKRMLVGLSALIAAGLLVSATSVNTAEVMKVELVNGAKVELVKTSKLQLLKGTSSYGALGSTNSPIFIKVKE